MITPPLRNPEKIHDKDQQGGENQSMPEGSGARMASQNHNSQHQRQNKHNQSHHQNDENLKRVPEVTPANEEILIPASTVQTDKKEQQMLEKQKALTCSNSNKRKRRKVETTVMIKGCALMIPSPLVVRTSILEPSKTWKLRISGQCI